MGFNLSRWLFDRTYRAVKKWKRVHGDKTLKVDFPLTSESIVFDVGAYTGDYAAEIGSRYRCRVEAFEPIEAYADLAREAVADLAQVTVHTFGLSDRTKTLDMTVEGLGSSAFRSGSDSVPASFRDVSEVISDARCAQIDLIKINVEGGEYEILPRLIETRQIEICNFILVQFHLIRNGDRDRYSAVATGLSKTHRLAWRFPFIWELWERR
jgi:FkbM family methyltransferase